MSDEHFTVDGTLIEAWASQKSFQQKDVRWGGDGRNFHGDAQQRTPRCLEDRSLTQSYTARADGQEAKLELPRARSDGRTATASIVDAMLTQPMGLLNGMQQS